VTGHIQLQAITNYLVTGPQRVEIQNNLDSYKNSTPKKRENVTVNFFHKNQSVAGFKNYTFNSIVLDRLI
jgi:hypothetical protein